MSDFSFRKFGMKKAVTIIFFLIMLHVFPAKSQPGSSAQILFLANINGLLENCHCGNPSLGGIDRIAALVKQLRKNSPGLIYVDGGDFFNSYSYPRLNKAVLKAYDVLKPDILTPGDQEWVEGFPFFIRNIKPLSSKLLYTNLRLSGNGQRGRIRTYAFGRHRLVFLSFLDSAAFEFVTPDKRLVFQNEIFRRFYQKTKAGDFLIVIYHGPQKAFDRFIARYPRIDCVLLAHQQRLEDDLQNRPALIGGAEDGAYLKRIEIGYKKNAYKLKVEKLAIYDSLKKDPSVLRVIQDFKISK